jgi:predicted AAA+ superfamily ATPase
MIPVLPRILGVDETILGKYYFVIHAPRQSGKTTYLQYLTEQINLSGHYYALYCSLEALDSISDRNEGINEILFQLHDALISSGNDKLIQLSLNYIPTIKFRFNYENQEPTYYPGG